MSCNAEQSSGYPVSCLGRVRRAPRRFARASLFILLAWNPAGTGLAGEEQSRGSAVEELRDQAFATFEAAMVRYREVGMLPDVRASFDSARSMWIEVAGILMQQGDEHSRSQILVNIAGIHSLYGDLAGTKDWARQALEVARQAERYDTQSSALSMLASVARREDDSVLGVALLDTAYAAIRGKGFEAKEAQILLELGDGLRDIRESERSLDHYEAAATLANQIGDPGIEADAVDGMARVYASLDLLEDALEHFEKARDMYAEAGSRSQQVAATTGALGIRGALTSKLLGQAMAGDDCELRYRALDAASNYLSEDAEQMGPTLEMLHRIIRDRDGPESADELVGQMRAELERQAESLAGVLVQARASVDELCGATRRFR